MRNLVQYPITIQEMERALEWAQEASMQDLNPGDTKAAALFYAKQIINGNLTPIILCCHCGRDERDMDEGGSPYCNAPFDSQPHDFSRLHPYLRVERVTQK